VTPGTVVKRSARDVAFCKPQVSTDWSVPPTVLICAPNLAKFLL
jgi:hypothetical protein